MMTDDLTAVLRRAPDASAAEYDPADIELRGNRMRRNRQRAVTMLAAALVVAVSVVSVAGMQTWLSSHPAPAASVSDPSTPVPSVSAVRAFIPATRAEGGNVIMPVTFLDGTTAEIVYPPDLDLAGLGAVPGGSAQLDDPPLQCCARDFSLSYGEWFGVVTAGEPVTEYPGTDGTTVRLFRGQQGAPDYLVFEIGPWRLGVWDGAGDPMSDHLRGLWSAHLSGRVSADGFPVLSATSPLRLASAGAAYGPSLTFATRDGNSVVFRPTPSCPSGYAEPRVDDESDDPVSLVLCRANWSMRVNVIGDRTFVRRVLTALQVRSVRVAAT